MKKLTVALPEELFHLSKEYAEKQGISLNEMILNLLKQTVHQNDVDPVQQLINNSLRLSIDTLNVNWTKSDIYDRNIFSNQQPL